MNWFRHKSSQVLLGLAVIMLAASLAYANSFRNSFHFDDFHTITDNPAIRSLDNVGRFFTDTSTFSVRPANRTYRPIVSLSLALDYAFGHGLETTTWFHVSTFFWFLVLLSFLFLLYERILDRTEASAANLWLALGMTAWFGLHPAIAETVNYIIQRGDLYCTLGCVAALAIWARWPERRASGIYLIPLALALLSKPPAAVFPVLLFFYAAYFEFNQSRWKRAAVVTLPSLVITGILMWLQSAMTPKSFAPSALDASAYRLTQPYVWLRYFGELFLPLHLNVDTDLGVFDSFNGRALAGLLFVAVLAIGIWRTSKHKTLYPVAYGLIWFLVTQLPTSLYALSEVENDHRMFFSFVGLILAVVWSGWLLLLKITDTSARKTLRPVLLGCILLALTGYAWGVHVRNTVWHDETSLWKDDAEKSPHNGRGLMIYGLTLMGHGDYAGALDYYQRALVYTPYYSTLEINMAIANGATGNSAEAERHFRRALDLAPNDDQAHSFYARWLTQQGRFQEAITQLKTALALNPDPPMQHDELIQAYERAGDMENARKTAQETLATIPGDRFALAALQAPAGTNSAQHVLSSDVAALINRSLVLNQAGKYMESIAAAREALKIDPRCAEAWNNISADDESLQRWDDAIAAAQKAIALKPDFQLAKNNLAWSVQQKSKATGNTK